MKRLWLGGLLQLLNGLGLTHIGPKHQFLTILQDTQADSAIGLVATVKYNLPVYKSSISLMT